MDNQPPPQPNNSRPIWIEKQALVITFANSRFVIECPCGYRTQARATLEAAGRDIDMHQAAKFPIGTQRRPCRREAE